MNVSSQYLDKTKCIRFDNSFQTDFDTRLFDLAWLQTEGHVVKGSMGRGAACILNYGRRKLVLRFFLRGGLLRKFNRDLYLRTGLENSRPFREYELLRWMSSRGLRVPHPIAAMVAPVGPFYRAAIVLECIPNAITLAEVLKNGPLPNKTWRGIGRAIRALHDAHVFHADLNCRNILIDDMDQVWLIDFDKSRRRAPGPWAQRNINRLERSLLKERRQSSVLHMDDQNWTELLSGYAASDVAQIQAAASEA